MENIIAEALRKVHDISIHAGNGDIEQDVACLYALEDVINSLKDSAELAGIFA